MGARLVDGFEFVADAVGLDEQLEGVDLVVTGEGFLDAQSFEGKVVGGVTGLAAALAVPVLVIAGDIYDGVDAGLDAVSLVARVGADRAFADPLGAIREVVYERLR